MVFSDLKSLTNVTGEIERTDVMQSSAPHKKATSLILIARALVCDGFVRQIPAVVPPPDGGYPGFNTAEGQKALFSLTNGIGNVTVGGNAGGGMTSGNLNVCVGGGAGNSGFTFNNSIYVGHNVNAPGSATESNTIRIDALGFGIPGCFIQGILGAPNFADTVKIDPATGQLGDQPSSAGLRKTLILWARPAKRSVRLDG
jgi:hypothetical protein